MTYKRLVASCVSSRDVQGISFEIKLTGNGFDDMDFDTVQVRPNVH